MLKSISPFTPFRKTSSLSSPQISRSRSHFKHTIIPILPRSCSPPHPRPLPLPSSAPASITDTTITKISSPRLFDSTFVSSSLINHPKSLMQSQPPNPVPLLTSTSSSTFSSISTSTPPKFSYNTSTPNISHVSDVSSSDSHPSTPISNSTNSSSSSSFSTLSQQNSAPNSLAEDPNIFEIHRKQAAFKRALKRALKKLQIQQEV